MFALMFIRNFLLSSLFCFPLKGKWKFTVLSTKLLALSILGPGFSWSTGLHPTMWRESQLNIFGGWLEVGDWEEKSNSGCFTRFAEKSLLPYMVSHKHKTTKVA